MEQKKADQISLGNFGKVSRIVFDDLNIGNLSYNKHIVVQNKLNYRPRKMLSFNQIAAFLYNF